MKVNRETARKASKPRKGHSCFEEDAGGLHSKHPCMRFFVSYLGVCVLASVRNKLILGVIDAAQSKKGMNCVHCQIRTGEICLL